MAAEVLAGHVLQGGGHVRHRAGGGERLAELQQHVGPPHEVGGVVDALVGGPAQLPLRDLGRARGGEVLQHRQLVGGPRPRLGVDGGQRPDHPLVLVADRPAGVGDDVEVVDGAVVPQSRVEAGVGEHERLLVGHDVLAEGVRERRLAGPLVRRGQALGAGEDLAVLLDDRHQGHRDPERVPHEPGVAVEGRVGNELVVLHVHRSVPPVGGPRRRAARIGQGAARRGRFSTGFTRTSDVSPEVCPGAASGASSRERHRGSARRRQGGREQHGDVPAVDQRAGVRGHDDEERDAAGGTEVAGRVVGALPIAARSAGTLAIASRPSMAFSTPVARPAQDHREPRAATATNRPAARSRAAGRPATKASSVRRPRTLQRVREVADSIEVTTLDPGPREHGQGWRSTGSAPSPTWAIVGTKDDMPMIPAPRNSEPPVAARNRGCLSSSGSRAAARPGARRGRTPRSDTTDRRPARPSCIDAVAALGERRDREGRRRDQQDQSGHVDPACVTATADSASGAGSEARSTSASDRGHGVGLAPAGPDVERGREDGAAVMPRPTLAAQTEVAWMRAGPGRVAVRQHGQPAGQHGGTADALDDAGRR